MNDWLEMRWWDWLIVLGFLWMVFTAAPDMYALVTGGEVVVIG